MIAKPSVRIVPAAKSILERGVEVVRIESDALALLADSLDEAFVDACNAILATRGRVVLTGMGKSGHIGRKLAATFAATGTPAIYVHPADAAHGDLGMLVPGDILVMISNSGNTSELHAFLKYAEKLRVPVIGIASNRDSLVLAKADIGLCLPPAREACPANIAPTTSTTLQLALGDALAMAVMDLRGFSRDGMKALHPGGVIGLRLTAVTEIMHSGDELPLVPLDAPMKEVVVTMTSRGFGIAGVTNEGGQLVGVITDGDLRRHFDDLASVCAAQVMTNAPWTLPSDTLAEDALYLFNDAKITCAFVFDAAAAGEVQVPIGIVHIHDFLRIGLA